MGMGDKAGARQCAVDKRSTNALIASSAMPKAVVAGCAGSSNGQVAMLACH